MPRIHIVTDDGELVETLDVDKTWDLDSPIHRDSIKEWAVEALLRAQRIKEDNDTGKKR
jgi:hypothetical protein